MASILVLGAGMVGTCTALHLQQRGHEVVLVDRGHPGRETSFGNAGLIQREAVEPYPFPRDAAKLLQVALGRPADVHYHAQALPALLAPLFRYWRLSSPASHARIAQDYARLIVHCLAEHQPLIAAAGAEDLVRREGFRKVYRSHSVWQAAVREAERLSRAYGIRHQVLDGQALAQAEPALHATLAGAVHWQDPWSVNDPGELVARYASLFEQRGGLRLRADATSLQAQGAGWRVRGGAGWVDAAQAVIALGPWSDALIRPLGYRLPLFVKRGYHQHYRGGAALRLPMLDAEQGFLLLPARRHSRTLPAR